MAASSSWSVTSSQRQTSVFMRSEPPAGGAADVDGELEHALGPVLGDGVVHVAQAGPGQLAVEGEEHADLREDHELGDGIVEELAAVVERHGDELHVDVDLAEAGVLELLRDGLDGGAAGGGGV